METKLYLNSLEVSLISLVKHLLGQLVKRLHRDANLSLVRLLLSHRPKVGPLRLQVAGWWWEGPWNIYLKNNNNSSLIREGLLLKKFV